MPFKKFVEVGRLAVVNFGPDYGQTVLISDIIDQNRVLFLASLCLQKWVLRSWWITPTSAAAEL